MIKESKMNRFFSYSTGCVVLSLVFLVFKPGGGLAAPMAVPEANNTPQQKEKQRTSSDAAPVPGVADDSVQVQSERFYARRSCHAFLLWNGKRDETGKELLLWQDEEKSLTGKNETVMRVLPFPSRPETIPWHGEWPFEELCNLVDKKIEESGLVAGDVPRVEFFRSVMPLYSIDQYEINTSGPIHGIVTGLVKKCDVNRLRVAPIESMIPVLENYNRTGDSRSIVVEERALSARLAKSQPVLFYFSSPKPYWPYWASSLGSKGFCSIDLFLVSSEKPAVPLSNDQYNVMIVGNNSFMVTSEQIQEVLPATAFFFKENIMPVCWITNIVIQCRQEKLQSDLMFLFPRQ